METSISLLQNRKYKLHASLIIFGRICTLHLHMNIAFQPLQTNICNCGGKDANINY